MDDTIATPETDKAADTAAAGVESPAKERFARAVEEAKAGAQALGKEAQERADLYREKLTSQSSEWSAQAKERATGLAVEGKARASEAIAGIGKLVAENATLIDDKVGAKYGDYARTAAQSLQDTATKLDSKDLGELADDAKEFVRNSPGLAVGLAAAAGFLLARVFRGSND
ncbi:MAG: hypothetical protein IT550_04135 [Novosphingobium sp.]|nr:hypothetical protein [Novosphingobium sp.]